MGRDELKKILEVVGSVLRKRRCVRRCTSGFLYLDDTRIGAPKKSRAGIVNSKL